jgi:hypothetical protein
MYKRSTVREASIGKKAMTPATLPRKAAEINVNMTTWGAEAIDIGEGKVFN